MPDEDEMDAFFPDMESQRIFAHAKPFGGFVHIDQNLVRPRRHERDNIWFLDNPKPRLLVFPHFLVEGEADVTNHAIAPASGSHATTCAEAKGSRVDPGSGRCKIGSISILHRDGGERAAAH